VQSLLAAERVERTERVRLDQRTRGEGTRQPTGAAPSA
jgi:hypothetical protein